MNWLDQLTSAPRCVPDCILNELPRQIQILRITSDVYERALALSWMLHLVGDLHQPLHVGEHDDLGGNRFPVSYRGSAFYLCGNREVVLNLHHVWDDNIVDELVYRMGSTSLPAAAVPEAVARAQLAEAGVAGYAGQSAASGTLLDWAEAHAIAYSVAYNGLRPGDDLQNPYILPAFATVRDQLLKVGIRLAMILDQDD